MRPFIMSHLPTKKGLDGAELKYKGVIVCSKTHQYIGRIVPSRILRGNNDKIYVLSTSVTGRDGENKEIFI